MSSTRTSADIVTTFAGSPNNWATTERASRGEGSRNGNWNLKQVVESIATLWNQPTARESVSTMNESIKINPCFEQTITHSAEPRERTPRNIYNATSTHTSVTLPDWPEIPSLEPAVGRLDDTSQINRVYNIQNTLHQYTTQEPQDKTARSMIEKMVAEIQGLLERERELHETLQARFDLVDTANSKLRNEAFAAKNRIDELTEENNLLKQEQQSMDVNHAQLKSQCATMYHELSTTRQELNEASANTAQAFSVLSEQMKRNTESHDDKASMVPEAAFKAVYMRISQLENNLKDMVYETSLKQQRQSQRQLRFEVEALQTQMTQLTTKHVPPSLNEASTTYKDTTYMKEQCKQLIEDAKYRLKVIGIDKGSVTSPSYLLFLVLKFIRVAESMGETLGWSQARSQLIASLRSRLFRVKNSKAVIKPDTKSQILFIETITKPKDVYNMKQNTFSLEDANNCAEARHAVIETARKECIARLFDATVENLAAKRPLPKLKKLREEALEIQVELEDGNSKELSWQNSRSLIREYCRAASDQFLFTSLDRAFQLAPEESRVNTSELWMKLLDIAAHHELSHDIISTKVQASGTTFNGRGVPATSKSSFKGNINSQKNADIAPNTNYFKTNPNTNFVTNTNTNSNTNPNTVDSTRNKTNIITKSSNPETSEVNRNLNRNPNPKPSSKGSGKSSNKSSNKGKFTLHNTRINSCRPTSDNNFKNNNTRISIESINDIVFN